MALSDDIDAAADGVLELAAGTHELDASVTENTTTIRMKHGVVITFVDPEDEEDDTRVLGSAIDFSAGGQIRVWRGLTFVLTGKLTLPPNHHAFDISLAGVDPSLGGSFDISPQSIDRLTPYNFGARGDDPSNPEDVDIESVDTMTDELTVTGHLMSTGDQVQLTTTGTLPSPLQTNTEYWVIKIDENTIQLATSAANALAGTAIALTSSGSPTNSITPTFDDIPLRAWIAACEHNVGLLAATGGIIPYVPPGEFRFGTVLDTDSRGDHVALQWRKHICKIQGAGSRNSRFHFSPRMEDDGQYFFAMRWESRISVAAKDVSSVSGSQLTTITNHGLSTGNQVQLTTTVTLPSPLSPGTTYWVIEVDADTIELAISRANALAGMEITLTTGGSGTHTISGASNADPTQSPGVSGITISTDANETESYLKCGLDFHDCRHLRLQDVHFPNWSKDGDPRCIGIRVRGRDSLQFDGIKTRSCDIPIVLDHNDEEIEPLSGGLPTVWRDDKDIDHLSITNSSLTVTDNRYKAAIWIKPGVVVRNLTVGPYVALVGGGIVCVDRLDSAPDDVDSVSAANDTLTLNGHLMSTGDQVQISSDGTLPMPLEEETWYWVIRVDASTIQLATSSANALAGTEILLDDAGSGQHTISGAAFAGAAVEPRRASNHWDLAAGRTEGIMNASASTFAVRVERHENGRLRELTIEDHLLAEGSDARRVVETGGGSYLASTWSGIRATGVERVILNGGVRYAGNGTPLEVDDDCLVETSPVADLVASDNNRRFPEIDEQWDFLGVSRLRSWWLMQEPTQGEDIADEQRADANNYALDATGSTPPTYAQLLDGWRGLWIQFTDGFNDQRLRLNSSANELNPAAFSVAATGIWLFTAAPAGNRDLCNLAGDSNGPILRLNTSGQLFIRANGVSGSASTLTYTDGQPFIFWLAHNRTLETLTCWLTKFDGSRELITGTYFDSPGNNVNKGFGPHSTPADSPAGWLRFGGWALDAAARQNGYDVFRALGWLEFENRTTFLSALGATGTTANNGYATIASGGGALLFAVPDQGRRSDPVLRAGLQQRADLDADPHGDRSSASHRRQWYGNDDRHLHRRGSWQLAQGFGRILRSRRRCGLDLLFRRGGVGAELVSGGHSPPLGGAVMPVRADERSRAGLT